MIFVTVGMHHQGFERLIRSMDEVARSIDEPVLMQIGASSYEPCYAEWFRFADQEQVSNFCVKASVIVGHAGAGTIIAAFHVQRPLIVVPRRLRFGEHVDDHQIELAEALFSAGKVIALDEPEPTKLIAAIGQAFIHRQEESGSIRLSSAIAQILSNGSKRSILGPDSKTAGLHL